MTMPVDRMQERRLRGWCAGRLARGLFLPVALGVASSLAAMPASAQHQQHEARPEGAAPPSAKPATREQLVIVGSSIMDHITEAVVRHLAEEYVLPEPIIRLQGTRAGIAEFCAGVGPEYPDIVAASDRMSQGEFETCVENNVLDVIQIEIGDSVVVVVTKIGDPVFNLTPRMVYYGLAEDIPDKGAFKTNENKTWRETDKEAPDLPINVIVPAHGFDTRRYFDDNFMQGGCRHVKEIDAIFAAADRVPLCITPRDDGPFVEVAEDQIIDALMKAPRGTLAVVAWPAYIENRDKVEALPVNGFLPTHENIDGDDYTMTSTLRYYFKRAHMRKKVGGQGVVEGLQEFMSEIVKDEASGDGGYLETLGLVPLSPAERRTQQTIARRMKRFEP